MDARSSNHPSPGDELRVRERRETDPRPVKWAACGRWATDCCVDVPAVRPPRTTVEAGTRVLAATRRPSSDRHGSARDLRKSGIDHTIRVSSARDSPVGGRSTGGRLDEARAKEAVGCAHADPSRFREGDHAAVQEQDAGWGRRRSGQQPGDPSQSRELTGSVPPFPTHLRTKGASSKKGGGVLGCVMSSHTPLNPCPIIGTRPSTSGFRAS